MTTLNPTTAAPFGAIATYRAIHAVETALNSLVAWNTKRITAKQLNALSAHQLNDIGLTYADVKNLHTGLFH